MSIVGWCVMIAFVATGCTDPEPAVSLPEGANATVEYVVDGDTIDVMIDGREERVRLTGIDTPEKARRDTGAPAQCFGDEATSYTATLLPVGTPVRLERDVVGRDDYGRILAYVYRVDDGIFVNYEIVRQGYARPLTIPPNVIFSDRMVDAARDAEADDVGLWSACAG
ncbi:MAG: thermonuclease family protein [Ilumatobacteraceae bacterium]